ncbi:MAG: 50S ribosomal protein L35 [Bdellovibrio sp.]|nr:MAG: 50S ribosomal protein L35 [Bdellovibrio sp.]
MKKLKTHSGAKKRFRVTGKGKVKRSKPNRRHILSKKSSKRKRQLGKKTYVNPSNSYQVERMLVI